MTYVVVGFRVDEENAVFYRKCRSLEELKEAVAKAFEKHNCHFVSVRRVEKTAQVGSGGRGLQSR